MELHELDLNLLRVFDAVYAQSNLSKAAKELGISQSAVSNVLGRLRDALGQPLFVRSGQGVAATTYADSIAPQIAQALTLLRGALQEAAFNYRLSNRRFTLICSDYSAAVVLPAVMARVQQLAPGVTLHHVGGHSDGLQIVRVPTARGPIVLASDAAHYYGNLHRRSPFPIVYNVGHMIDGWATAERLAGHIDRVIPGHDPLVSQIYPRVSEAADVFALHRTPSHSFAK